MKFCVSCGTENEDDAIFCTKCGYNFNEESKTPIKQILAFIVGIVGSVYVKNNAKSGGIILIVSAIWLLISISAYGILGAVLLGIGGLLALIRK